MESKAHYALVGLVVIILTVALVSALLWLSGAGAKRTAKHYSIYVREQSLDGMQVNSAVTMKGVKVGSVASYKISPVNIEEIRVVLDLDENTPVKEDTHAVVRRNLLTGLAYIDLVGSSQQSPLLTAVRDGDPYPVIPEGKSELSAIAQSVPNLMEKGGALFDSAREVFSADNKQQLSQILVNISRISAALGENDKKISALISNATELVQELKSVSGSLQKATADDKLTKISDNLAATLEGTKKATETLDSQIVQVAATLKNSAEAIVKQTGSLSANLSRAADNFSATVERFEEPRAALLGPGRGSLGPGEAAKVPK